MAIVSLNELKSYFQTGDYPTEQQFGNFIDTMGNVLEVVNNIGSKLFHDPSISYPANSAVMTTAGIWYNIDPVGPSAFNTNDWTLLFSFTSAPNVVSLGVPSYEPTKNDYTTGNQVNWKNVIYEAIDGPFGGIEPGVDPSWEDYWVAVVYTEGGIIPVLTTGFVKFGRVYEYTGNDAPKGLYRSIAFEGGYDGGYKLSIGDFATHLALGRWQLVAIKEASGGSLSGTNYLFVGMAGTPAQNFTEFNMVYTAAKAMDPNSTALAADNRITILVAPGYIEGDVVIDTAFIDIVSLTGEADVVIKNGYGLSIDTDNVTIRGLQTIDLPILATGVYSNTTLIKCIGGDGSFTNCYGTFIDCKGGNQSFGYEAGTTSGTFIRCEAGTASFGGGSGGVADGTFIDCKAGGHSFGDDDASGSFTRCESGEQSFGRYNASGTFNHCVGGDKSFGFTGGSFTGKAYFCRLLSNSFPTVGGSGKTRYCINGDDSADNQG
jgi:hypothetical protein